MANIKSAIKRIDITKRNTLRNKQYSSKIKTFTKKYFIALENYKQNPNDLTLSLTKLCLNRTFSSIDKAHKAHVLHKNTAARKKSTLNFVLNSSVKN
jgi:small subunit ribosomal protein S20